MRREGDPPRDTDFKKSDKAVEWKDPPVLSSPLESPTQFPVEGRCAVVLDNKAGYCGAPCGNNAFRFCEFHADRYLNKQVRLR